MAKRNDNTGIMLGFEMQMGYGWDMDWGVDIDDYDNTGVLMLIIVCHFDILQKH